MLQKKFTQGMKLGCIPACLANRGIVIIARGLRRKRRTVGAGGKPEGGAAVHHIDTEGGVVLEHPTELFDDSTAVTGVMRFAPTVEPPGIILTAHQRALRPNLTQGFEVAFGVSAEIYDAKQIIPCIVFKLRRPIASEQRHFKT